MVQTGMSTPYTAFAQNGGPGAAGDTSSMKSDMKGVEGVPPGGGGGGGSPTALQVLQQSAQHVVNGVVDQQQNATVNKSAYLLVTIAQSLFPVPVFRVMMVMLQLPLLPRPQLP